MLKVGLISDTHSWLDPEVFKYFADCDEIWHMGDIGSVQIIEQLQELKPLKAVFGNIDDANIRHLLPEDLIFEAEGLKVLITHIGSIPPKYSGRIQKLLKIHSPDLFLCGHSHILRVIKDREKFNLAYINPGAAGRHGFHHVRTIMRMTLENRKITHLEAIELGKR